MAAEGKSFWAEVKSNWAKNKMLLWALGLAGVLLLVLPGNCQQRSTPVADSGRQQLGYQQQLQQELEAILARIEGAGRVQVMLTLDDEQEYVYAVDKEIRERSTNEEDNQGGQRQQVEYDQRGQLVVVRVNNQEQPVVVKVIKPRVRGVLVVSSGANNPVVRQRIIQAVQGVLDVPAYRITVQKGR